ncbi:ATP-binding protein [Luedemannella helvata]|uniref:histidine kinase n=1 Tax=Luedemannella helvata TaxID=349315 RepID=A0ABP4VZ57_9ACTN
MRSTRNRLRFLVAALLACLVLLATVAAIAAVRHLAGAISAPDVSPLGALLGVGDVAILIAVAVAGYLVPAVGREVAAVRERRADLTRDVADGLGDLLIRVARGEAVDHTGGAGRLAADDDDTLRAFAQAYAAAAGAALAQAALVRDVRRLAVGLARRGQSLVADQLRLLDATERDCLDADDLARLFEIDHLATRLRRQIEDLLILCGDTPERDIPATVPVLDVVRAALCEVADYPRVRLLPIESAWLHGDAVPDVTHLLAELMENALRFSPATTAVRVTGAALDGYTIEIEDSGIGMAGATRVLTNDDLVAGSAAAVSAGGRLGVAVAARLAQRQGIEVRLRESPHGGTIAVVVLPAALLAPAASVTRPRRVVLGTVPGGSLSGGSLSGGSSSGGAAAGALPTRVGGGTGARAAGVPGRTFATLAHPSG